MKTLINQFRILAMILVFFMSISTHAQNNSASKKSFVRIYNFEGKKIAKGNIIAVNDSLLILKKGSINKELNYEEIWMIKTRHSGGNNVLIGAGIGATLGAIAGAASGDSNSGGFSLWSPGEGALMFGIMGAVGGAGYGGISTVFKNSVTYNIHGNKDRWTIFVEDFNNDKVN